MNKQEIQTRMAEIEEILDKDPVEGEEEVNIDELEKEVKELTENLEQVEAEERKVIETAEKRKNILSQVAQGVKGEVISEKKEERNDKKMEDINVLETKEYRSAFLKRLMGAKLNEVEQRAMTTAEESVGSTVPTTTANRIEELLRQTSALYPHVTVLNVSGYLSIPKELVTNDASWVAEGVASEDVNDTTTAVSFAAYKLIRTISITAEVQTMSVDAFESYIVKKLSDKMASGIENAILNGTGDGQPKGILVETYNETNSVSYTTAMGYDDFADLLGLLKAGYKPGAKFTVNGKTLWGQIAKIKDEEKRPLFIPDVRDGFAGRILGIPVIENEFMPDDKVLLGNFSKYTINFNKGIDIATDTSVEFRKADKVYRSMALLDGKVVNQEAFVLIQKSVTSA